jgi:hypothetical protein
MKRAFKQQLGNDIRGYGKLSERQKRDVDQKHDEFIKRIQSMQNDWKDVSVIGGAQGVQLQTALVELQRTVVDDATHTKREQRRHFFEQHIAKSGIHNRLQTISTLKHFGQQESPEQQAYTTDHPAFVNADMLKSHLKQQLHIGEAHMMTDAQFEQQFRWEAPAFGFDAHLRRLAHVHALGTAHTVRRSVAMQKAIGVHRKMSFHQLTHHLLLPANTAKISALNKKLNAFHNVVKNIDGYESFELHKKYDTVEQKYMDFKHAMIDRLVSWFSLKYTGEYNAKNKMKDAYVLPTELDFRQEERTQLHNVDVEIKYIHQTIPDVMHRRIHLLMLQQQNNNTETGPHGRKALEQFALHQPESFEQFMKDYERTSNWLEVNVFSSRNTYTWSGALFDTCSNVLDNASTKDMTTDEATRIEAFYTNTHVKQFLTMTPKSIQDIQHSVKQQYDNANSVLRKIPRSVVQGENDLYWTNDNADMNRVHFKRPFVAKKDGYTRGGYERWLDE